MQTTTDRTAPLSYPQCAQSTRACLREAGRASHTGAGFIDFAVRCSKPVGFILQERAKLAPTGIVDRFGHTGFAQLCAGNVTDYNQLCPVGNGRGGLMRPVLATVGHLGMDSLDALVLVSTLGDSKRLFVLARQILSGVRLINIRARDLVLQPQVNPDLSLSERDASVVNLTLEVDVPMATGILREAPSLHGAIDGTRAPESETPSQIPDTVLSNLQKSRLEGYPAERTLSTPPVQPDFLRLTSAFGVLLTDGADRLAVQAKFLPSPSRQGDQVEGRQHVFIPTPGQQRDFVAVVPHEVAGVPQLLQVLPAGAVFDPIPVGQHATGHGGFLAPRCISLSFQLPLPF